MKNIIIVGSRGLIGKALCKGLSKKFNIIEIDIMSLKKKNYYKCNILNELDTKNIFKKIFTKYKKINV